jgi:voltage-gated potassium channel
VSPAPLETLPAAERRRLVVIGLLRASATTLMVVAAYYLLPLDNLAGISLGIALAVGLLALTAVVAYQVRAIIRHRHSAVRAIEALAITVPVFLVLFAATYFMMEQSSPDGFNVDSLTRTDSLYFTVTVFATVGFGDITATSQVARVVLVLGLVVKVFLGAVEKGRGRQTTRQDSGS